MTTAARGLTKHQIARRAAQDIPDGSYVNLGIGLPELVGGFIPVGREVVFHTENGLLGMGPPPSPGEGDPDLIKRRQAEGHHPGGRLLLPPC